MYPIQWTLSPTPMHTVLAWMGAHPGAGGGWMSLETKRNWRYRSVGLEGPLIIFTCKSVPFNLLKDFVSKCTINWGLTGEHPKITEVQCKVGKRFLQLHEVLIMQISLDTRGMYLWSSILLKYRINNLEFKPRFTESEPLFHSHKEEKRIKWLKILNKPMFANFQMPFSANMPQ